MIDNHEHQCKSIGCNHPAPHGPSEVDSPDGQLHGRAAESALDSLLLAREGAFRAMEMGEKEIVYRGWWIEIEDHERGWEYVFDGHRRGEPLEDIFKRIDEREGSTEEEIEELAEAWAAHLEVRP